MQNFRGMVDSILQYFPETDPNMIKGLINDQIRNLIARRPWSGLVKYSMLKMPDSYTTGAVSATYASNVLTGASTAWAVSDLVSTTLSIATIETGIIDITPASMTGITSCQWLLIDGGNASEEAVYVISTNTAEGTFRARTTLTHSAAVTIKCSSLAGLQLRISQDVPFITITGVSSTTRALLQETWPVASVSAQGYSITKTYTVLGDDVKEILTVVNTRNQYQFDLYTPKPMLDWIDPLRTATNYPFRLVPHAPDPAGVQMWELYPRPTVQSAFPSIYIKQWLPLEQDNDILPGGIRSDVIVKRVKADCARWPGHKLKAGGVYYDPRLADALMLESEKIDIPTMMLEDDNTSIMSLYFQYKRFPVGGSGPDYDQRSPSTLDDYGVSGSW